jgi:hypothetical protein
LVQTTIEKFETGKHVMHEIPLDDIFRMQLYLYRTGEGMSKEERAVGSEPDQPWVAQAGADEWMFLAILSSTEVSIEWNGKRSQKSHLHDAAALCFPAFNMNGIALSVRRVTIRWVAGIP